MSKTAIVPVKATQPMLTKCYGLARAWPEVVNARPPVPDELIEEAAKAMQAADSPHSWDEIPDYEHEEYRNMARAAARVFNGGKDE